MNRGIIPVSADSPFVGSNLYLAKEMEESVYLHSFIRNRGAPRAIELSGRSERSATMNLYYASSKELYRASPHTDPNNRAKEWIITGPYALDKESYRQIERLGPENGAAFEIFGRREVLGGPLHAKETRVIVPAFIPTPTPTPLPVRRVRKKKTEAAATPTDAKTTPGALLGTPSTFDQQALLEAKAPVMASPAPSLPATTPSVAAPKKQRIDDALKDTVNRQTPPPVPSKAP